MITIFCLIESLAGGGAEKVFTDLIKNLDKEKYDITVCTISNRGIYDQEVAKHCNVFSVLNYEDYKQGGLKKMQYWLKNWLIHHLPSKLVYRYLCKKNYDVEIAFVEGFATKIMAASTNQNSKKLAWVHIDMEKNPYADLCYRNHAAQVSAYQKFDYICCVSRSVKNVFEKKFLSSDRVIIQYNPVDSIEIQKKASEKIDLTPNKTLQLGTIGRLERPKGFIRLIKCLGEIAKDKVEFSLWIIGEGSQRTELEELIHKLGMQDRIKLLGFHDNPYKFISRCDAFVCSSYAEGFSTAATESLILGKPIFTTDCAGMSELFGNFKCGEIVDNTDDALMEMLKKLLFGIWNPSDYVNDVKKRASDFDIKKRMVEIERLLDE